MAAAGEEALGHAQSRLQHVEVVEVPEAGVLSSCCGARDEGRASGGQSDPTDNVYVRMYACMAFCMYICMYLHTHRQVIVHMCMFICACEYVHVNMCM